MSKRLRARIAAEIRARGPITWAEFMRAALYDPQEGFFAGAPVGAGGHFVTSPHVSPVFGMLVANQLRDCWHMLDRPDEFTIVEIGAGDGLLARHVIETAASDPSFQAPLRYVAVEQSAGARAQLDSLGISSLADMEEVQPFQGCVVANELLDNVPFRRIKKRGDQIVEVMLDVEEHDRLIEIERPASDALVVAAGGPPVDGRERPVAPAISELFADVAARLRRGYVFLFDYGFVDPSDAEPVRGYRSHRLELDLLDDPGSMDLTGPVDFTAVAEVARANGFEVWGPVSQREALLTLGYEAALENMRALQAKAESDGEWQRALEIFSARNQAAMLVDVHGLGSLRVIAMTTPGLPEPLVTRGS